MKEHNREYPLLAACGLNCGLCPRYYTAGSSRCPGCGGEGFSLVHPACGVLSCCARQGLAYCYLCAEYPCKKYDNADKKDSFITHKNQVSDFEKIRRNDLNSYQKELERKMEILALLLDNYDDGRRKSRFCNAVNLLPLTDLHEAITQLRQSTDMDKMTKKERAEAAEAIVKARAEQLGISLKLADRRCR